MDSVEGTGPLKLVRNRMTYAAFKTKRTAHFNEIWDSKRLEKTLEKDVEENGLIMFGGGNYMNTLV
jgi:hypothetical protein